MMKKYKLIIMLFACVSLAGCSSGLTEEQVALRDSGIEKIAQSDYDGAAADFNSALKLSKGRIGADTVSIVYYLAATDALQENYDSAIKHYTDLLEFDKDNADAYFLRGSIYLELGDTEAGISDYHSAVECEEDNYERYLQIYTNLMAQDCEKEAKQFLDLALEVKGDGAENYYYRGRVYLLLGQDDVAETAFSKAKDKGNDEAGIYLAKIYLEQGEDARARDLISTYTEEKNKTPKESALTGELLLALGEYDEALKTYNSALEELGDENSESRQALLKGQISALEFTGDFEKAKELAADYIAEYPADGKMVREMKFLSTR